MEGQALIQDFIQGLHRCLYTGFQSVKIEIGMFRKRIPDKGGKVNTSQKTAASGRQGFLCTGIYAGVCKGICIAQKTPAGDPVPEQRSRLGIVPVCICDLPKQLSGLYLFLNDFPCSLSGIVEHIFLIIFHCLHKILMDTQRYVCLCHLLQICLQLYKIRHIRVGTVQRDHQRSSSAVLTDQTCDQRIQFHKRYGTGSLFGCIVDPGPFGSKSGNINTASPSIAVSSGQFFRAVEDAFYIVLRWGYHVAVGVSHFSAFLIKTSVRQDPSAVKKFFLPDIPGHFFISPGNSREPFFKAFPLILIFSCPDIHSKLVLLPQPFLFCHVTPPQYFVCKSDINTIFKCLQQ